MNFSHELYYDMNTCISDFGFVKYPLNPPLFMMFKPYCDFISLLCSLEKVLYPAGT